MVQVLLCSVSRYVKLPQILVELKYILPGDQRIKIGVGIKLGPLLPLGQRMMYLGFGLLVVL